MLAALACAACHLVRIKLFELQAIPLTLALWDLVLDFGMYWMESIHD